MRAETEASATKTTEEEYSGVPAVVIGGKITIAAAVLFFL